MTGRAGLILALTGAMTLCGAGCSVNGFGLAQADVVEGPFSEVHTIWAPGLHLDTRAENPSLTLGVFEAQRFYTKCAPTPGAAATSAPFDLRRPELFVTRATGLNLMLGPTRVGVSLGVHERLVSGRANEDRPIVRSITVSAKNPETSKIQVHEAPVCSDSLERTQ